MANTRNYPVPTADDDADVPLWNDRLAAAVAADVDELEERAATIEDTDSPNITFGVVDENGLRTWIEAGPDGGPTDHAASKIAGSASVIQGVGSALVEDPVVISELGSSIGFDNLDAGAADLSFALVDNEGRILELELGPDGKITDRVLAAWASRMGTVAAGGQDFPTIDWAHWGDSLTAGTWPTKLAALTGRSHYNGGWGGQGYAQIAARQGGIPALVTVANNTIPASGAVAVTSISGSPLSNSAAGQGTLAGIAGTLTADAAGVHTFTRTANGEAVACPAKSKFTWSTAPTYRDRTVTLWTGRNSFTTTAPELVVASIAAMIDYLTPRVRRVIVMEIPPWVGEENGTAQRTTLNTMNAAIKAAYPEYWLPIATFLRTAEAATAAGIVFTAQDNTDITNGLTPTSLRGDGGHPNDAGDKAIAYRVHQEATRRGWI